MEQILSGDVVSSGSRNKAVPFWVFATGVTCCIWKRSGTLYSNTP